jgi:fructose-1-phosphate kinase PfkB-like protein
MPINVVALLHFLRENVNYPVNFLPTPNCREVSEWSGRELQPMKDIQAVVAAAVEGFAPPHQPADDPIM